MGVRLFLAGFDIEYTITRHETCIELSRSSEDDETSRHGPTYRGARWFLLWERETVEIGPAHTFQVISCGS